MVRAGNGSLWDGSGRIVAAVCRRPARPSFAAVFVLAVGGASVAGVVIGRAADVPVSAWDPHLVVLLRFMAGAKVSVVVAASCLVVWRARRPVTRGAAFAWVAASASMAIAPGLIWSLAHVGLAAGLFHAGVLTFLVLAWSDERLPFRPRSRPAGAPVEAAASFTMSSVPPPLRPRERERRLSLAVDWAKLEQENRMSLKHAMIAAGLVLAVPSLAYAQGTVGGAIDGANAGSRAAGPVGGVVGGAVGAATGTVNGVLGVPGAVLGGNGGCDTHTVTREAPDGSTESVRRSNCP